MKRKKFETIWYTVIAVVVVLAAVGMVLPILNAAKPETKQAAQHKAIATPVEEYQPTTKAMPRYFEPMDSLSSRL